MADPEKYLFSQGIFRGIGGSLTVKQSMLKL